MSEPISIWKHPVIFFVTRMFILLGLVLVIGGMGYSVAFFTTKPLFGIDFMANPELLTDYTNQQAVNALKYVQALTALGMFVLPAWHFCKALEKEPREYLKLNHNLTLTEILVAIGLIVSITPFISWLIYINEQMELPASFAHLEEQLKAAEEVAAKITTAFLNVDSINGLLVNLVVMALIAAIGEEFLFRGALQNFIKDVSGNKHFAVIFVAIIFSAIHGQFYGFLARFALGLVLGYAYLFTGNLWVSILIHFTNNAFAVVFAYAPFAKTLPQELQQDYAFEAWYINAGSAVLTVFLLMILYKLSLKQKAEHGG